jgi:hypothetical protein
LPRIAAEAEFPQESSRESLLESLHHGRRVAALRFAEQQMHMLGHHDVTDDNKAIAPADLLQNLEEQISILPDTEESAAVVTACGDEMKVSGTGVAMESGGHVGLLTTKFSVLEGSSELSYLRGSEVGIANTGSMGKSPDTVSGNPHLSKTEAVTKLVPSAEADSVHPTSGFPALPCRAFHAAPSGLSPVFVPPPVLDIEFRNSLKPRKVGQPRQRCAKVGQPPFLPWQRVFHVS